MMNSSCVLIAREQREQGQFSLSLSLSLLRFACLLLLGRSCFQSRAEHGHSRTASDCHEHRQAGVRGASVDGAYHGELPRLRALPAERGGTGGSQLFAAIARRNQAVVSKQV